MNVAENLKKLRKLRNLSQKQIALSIGMDQSQYSRIESGKAEPTISTLEKIAKALEVSAFEFLKEEVDYSTEVNLPLLEKVKLIDELEEAEKECLLKVIDMAIAKKRMKDTLSQLIAS